MPEFWINSGWGPATGRIPLEEGSLFIKSDEDVSSVQSDLEMINKTMVLPHLNNILKIEKLESIYDTKKSPASGYAKAVCNFIIKRYDNGRKDMENYINWRKSFDNDETLANILKLNNSEIQKMLSNEQDKNIKKYHLKKYIVNEKTANK